MLKLEEVTQFLKVCMKNKRYFSFLFYLTQQMFFQKFYPPWIFFLMYKLINTFIIFIIIQVISQWNKGAFIYYGKVFWGYLQPPTIQHKDIKVEKNFYFLIFFTKPLKRFKKTPNIFGSKNCSTIYILKYKKPSFSVFGFIIVIFL